MINGEQAPTRSSRDDKTFPHKRWGQKAGLPQLRNAPEKNGVHLVAFKTKLDGNYVRNELETTVSSAQSEALLNGNLMAVDVEAVQVAINYLNGAKIQPILHIENPREFWYVQSGPARVKICFDDVRYTDCERNQYAQDYELELELEEGPEIFLQRVAQVLSQQHGLIPYSQSKYERGISLLNVFATAA